MANLVFDPAALVITMRKTPTRDVFLIVAEREGFEPPVPLGTPVFKTGVIDHSTIFPSAN